VTMSAAKELSASAARNHHRHTTAAPDAEIADRGDDAGGSTQARARDPDGIGHEEPGVYEVVLTLAATAPNLEDRPCHPCQR